MQFEGEDTLQKIASLFKDEVKTSFQDLFSRIMKPFFSVSIIIIIIFNIQRVIIRLTLVGGNFQYLFESQFFCFFIFSKVTFCYCQL